MEIDDHALLLELRRALEAAADQGPEAQAAALAETLRRYNATAADLTRALRTLRGGRTRELSGLAGRLDALAEQRLEAAGTAEAVDRYLRDLSRGDGA